MTRSNSSIQSICVYCGSHPGNDPAFTQLALRLGQSIASNGKRLVYGGGDNGVMGATAKGTLDGGGQVLGVIPQFLLEYEKRQNPQWLDAAEMVTVPDMHTRKRMMFEEADAFIALPGGIGTLEELVEILTWAQLSRHEKPVALLNVGGFWDPFMDLLGHMSESGFLHNPARVRPLLFTEPEAMIEALVNGEAA